MRRDREEHQWRRRLSGSPLTLIARKRGEQTGLDTPVVHAINDESWVLVGFPISAEANALSSPPGDTNASLKLKGIDGGPHKQRSVWFNSIQHEEPYQGLTCEW